MCLSAFLLRFRSGGSAAEVPAPGSTATGRGVALNLRLIIEHRFWQLSVGDGAQLVESSPLAN